MAHVLGVGYGVITLLGMLMVLGLVLVSLAPDARERLVELGLSAIKWAKTESKRPHPECDEFQAALRARTRWVAVVPVLAAVNVTVFLLMAWGPGPVADVETLAEWGGNFWLRTRNGEWWRLVTSMFVHTGLLHLLVNMAPLIQVGLMLERLVGRAITAAAFLAAGVFASLVNLVTHPMAMSVGASGAVAGLYGLLFASSIWGFRRHSEVTMPLTVVKRLIPAAIVFFLYNLVNDSVGTAGELVGLLLGLVCGAVLTRGVSERKPAARRVLHTAAAALALAVLAAIPLRGVTDVKPELARTVATEDRTFGAYKKASDRFKNGRMTAAALASVIDDTVVPELQATDGRLKALTGVPTNHQPLVTQAEEYVELRLESWRLRAEWLRNAGKLPRRGGEAAQHQANNRTIAKAEETERAALEALQKIRSADAAN